MALSEGDNFPDATFKVMTNEGPKDVTTSDLFPGKKVIVFAVPGAFTPTCHKDHVPGYLEKLDELKAKGVDEVACLAVNDVFVMDAWADATGAKGKITFLADGNAEFAKAAGLELDLTAGGLGIRSQRFAMLVDDGRITVLHVDKDGGLDVSSADSMLKAI